eukprot:11967688-Alexandrium_andersonii.AAC.1
MPCRPCSSSGLHAPHPRPPGRSVAPRPRSPPSPPRQLGGGGPRGRLGLDTAARHLPVGAQWRQSAFTSTACSAALVQAHVVLQLRPG